MSNPSPSESGRRIAAWMLALLFVLAAVAILFKDTLGDMLESRRAPLVQAPVPQLGPPPSPSAPAPLADGEQKPAPPAAKPEKPATTPKAVSTKQNPSAPAPAKPDASTKPAPALSPSGSSAKPAGSISTGNSSGTRSTATKQAKPAAKTTEAMPPGVLPAEGNIIATQPSAPATAPTLRKAGPADGPMFHLIAGSFQQLEAAQSLSKELYLEGFSPLLLRPEKPDKPFRISVFHDTDRLMVEQYKRFFELQSKRQSWIMAPQ